MEIWDREIRMCFKLTDISSSEAEDCPSCDSSKQLSLTLHDTQMTLNFKHCPGWCLSASGTATPHYLFRHGGGAVECPNVIGSVYLDTL